MSTLEQQEIKQVVKEAIREAMLENNEMLKDIVAEVLEDMALLQRMEEGRETEFVPREEIMEALGVKP